MISNAATSLIRTTVPYLVAWLLSLSFAVPAEHAFAVTGDQARAALTGVLTFALGTIYYAAVRFLERANPKSGLLLGVPVRPSYPPKRRASTDDGSDSAASTIAANAGAELVDDRPVGGGASR